METPTCECGQNNWFFIPDSLAMACEGCGRVKIRTGEGYRDGASIQKWLNDTVFKDSDLPPLPDPNDEKD